jgi:hypothetical protein
VSVLEYLLVWGLAGGQAGIIDGVNLVRLEGLGIVIEH